MDGEHFHAGQAVYFVPVGMQAAWQTGTVQALNPADRKVTVTASTDGAKHVVPPASVHGIIERSYDVNDPDLFRIMDLHVATLLHCLKDRYEQQRHQYNSMGAMILSVNPFAPMPFNSAAEMQRYLASSAPDFRELNPSPHTLHDLQTNEF